MALQSLRLLPVTKYYSSTFQTMYRSTLLFFPAFKLSSSSVSLLRSHKDSLLRSHKDFSSRGFSASPNISIPKNFHGVLSKAFVRDPAFGPLHVFSITHHRGFHSTPLLKGANKDEDNTKQTQSGPAAQDSSLKVKRKKLKGKRAVVRWLKHFRYKKKKEYQRMTSEEKILYKLKKARNKEAKLLEDLKKLEPKEWSETTHDPEVLTPEEHFYFLKMGLKCKNYVPIGRRGVYQGVILNMHLHWKKHQTLQVIVKTFTPEEVKEIATELARLTGGIVLDIHEEDTIIMYRGKNYAQPPTEIMSPRVTLPRKKALDKSKHRDALRAVRRYIPRLEQELELLRAQHQNRGDHASEKPQDASKVDLEDDYHAAIPNSGLAPSNKLKALMDRYKNTVEEDGSMSDAGMGSESEDLSDMFETDSDTEGNAERPLYLQQFDKFPSNNKEGLQLMSMDPKRIENDDLAEFDEVDQIFIRAAELLRKKRK